jgi:tetratricopeptide (TPR) repeat protein
MGEASEVYEQCLKLNRDDPRVLFEVANFNRDIGQLKTARKLFMDVLKQEPKHVLATYNLGGVYLKLGEEQTSFELFKKASRLNPHNEAIFEQMGKLALPKGWVLFPTRLRMSRNTVMRASFRIATLLGASVVLLLGGCDGIARSLYLAGCDHDIKNSTRAIETARDDAQRVAGYSERGRAYSEKARYSRAFKLIPADEYSRLFGLAIKDHDQAIAFDPGSAERYFSQGRPITTGPPRRIPTMPSAGSSRQPPISRRLSRETSDPTWHGTGSA